LGRNLQYFLTIRVIFGLHKAVYPDVITLET
jgi:hypothetical protein